MRIKAILFDKDGTIFDFQKSWGNWFFELSKKLTKGNTDELIKIFEKFSFNRTNKTFNNDSVFASSTFEENIDRLKSVVISMKKEEIKRVAIESTQTMIQIPVTNLITIFSLLKSENYLLGIVTNDLENSTILQIEKEKIYNYFDYIVGSDSGYGAKPNCGQLVNFAKKFEIKPSETVMVGDTIQDMIAGKKANMHTIGVLSGISNEKELKPYADEVVRDISKIPEILKKFNT